MYVFLQAKDLSQFLIHRPDKEKSTKTSSSKGL